MRFSLVNVFTTRAEAPRLHPEVDRDLAHRSVEDPHQVRVVAHEHRPPEELRWYRVERLRDGDVSIAAHDALRLLEHGEAFRGERLQQRPLLLEHGAHLPLRRSVNPKIRDVLLPRDEERVLFGERVELTTLDRILLCVIDSTLDCALVSRGVRPCRQDDGAVVASEGLELRVEDRIEPIGDGYACLQIVDHQSGRDATERMERVLDRSQERLRVLTPNHLAVGLARAGEDDAKQVRSSPIRGAWLDRQRALAKVDLGLLAGQRLESPKRKWGRGMKHPDKSFNALIPPFEVLLRTKVLPDPLRGKPERQLRLDRAPMDLALTAPSRFPGGRNGRLRTRSERQPVLGAGGRNGRVWVVNRYRFRDRAGGRNGRFWFLSDDEQLGVPGYGFPMNTKFTGDAPMRPPVLQQLLDRVGSCHLEPVRHALLRWEDNMPGRCAPLARSGRFSFDREWPFSVTDDTW